MPFYLFLCGILIITIFPSFFAEYSKNRALKISIYGVLYTFSFILILLGGFRWEKGTDWKGYFGFFDNLSLSTPFGSYLPFEHGYILLNFFIKSVYNSYTAFLLIFHFLIIIYFISGIKNLSIFFPLAFFLFFCATKGSIFAVRMNLAGAILFHSTIYIIKKQKYLFIINVLIACSIHITSIIFLIAYPLYYCKLNKKSIVIFLCISIYVAFNTKFLVTTLLTPILNQIGTGRIVIKLLGYSEEATRNFFMIIVYIIRYALFIPVILYFCRREENSISGLFNLYFFGCLFFICFSTYLTQIQRAATYFTRYEWVLLPMVYTRIERKLNKAIFLICILLYGFYKYYSSFFAEDWFNLFVPYSSIFSGKI
jgi:hypothetical protein